MKCLMNLLGINPTVKSKIVDMNESEPNFKSPSKRTYGFIQSLDGEYSSDLSNNVFFFATTIKTTNLFHSWRIEKSLSSRCIDLSQQFQCE